MSASSSRLELTIPVVIAMIMLSGAALSIHRSSIKQEFMTKCTASDTVNRCQSQWWKSPLRSGWTTDNMWGCWVGNPRTCEIDAARKAEAEAAKKSVTQQPPP